MIDLSNVQFARAFGVASALLSNASNPNQFSVVQGGFNSLIFMALFILPDLRSVGVSLRERDFSYFGIDRWPPEAEVSVRCIRSEGEIPVLYRLEPQGAQVKGVEASSQPAFFCLVDFVAQTTGSGIGGSFAEAPQTEQSTDLRTGRRLRYRVRQLVVNEPDPPTIYWVERTENGSSASYATVTDSVRF